MEQENGRGGWYDTAENRQWEREYPPRLTAEIPAAPVKKQRTGLKATMIVVCVLILIAATALAFAPFGESGGEVLGNPATASDVPDFSNIPGFFEQFGGEGGGSADDYDDFRDYFDNYFTKDDGTQGSSISRTDPNAGISLALGSQNGRMPLSLKELYDKTIDSIVGISATIDGFDGYYWGTGIIMTADGYILTNAHIISGTDHCTVTVSDGTEYEAMLVGEDTQSDIAVLKIEASGLQSAEFGVSDELEIGDEVVAIGNPLGDELSGTMTNGIISAINRGIQVDGHVMTLIQTNAAINEGNSGGPLFNMYGQVIGITNMKMAAEYYQVTIEGIGFAIPTSIAKPIVDQLLAEGEVTGRPGIGITCGPVSTEAMERYGLPGGLYISEVEEKSDAYAEGIRAGDILTAVNGKAVSVIEDVNAIKDRLGVGDTMVMTIFRDGKTFDVEIELFDMNELF